MPSRDELPIVLVGLRGVGKTTVGRLLAVALHRRFQDLDDEIVRNAAERGLARPGSGAGEFLARHGLGEFRALEAATLETCLATSRPSVLASGGGVVEQASNRASLRERAVCVWLQAAPELLAARVDADTAQRPALVSGGSLVEAHELWLRRESWYREVAMIDVDCGAQSPEEVAATVLKRLSRLREHPRGPGIK